jgi:hypothetical protein
MSVLTLDVLFFPLFFAQVPTKNVKMMVMKLASESDPITEVTIAVIGRDLTKKIEVDVRSEISRRPSM